MSFEAALVQELKDNSGVDAGIGDRIYSRKAPEGATIPFAVYEIDDSQHEYTMTGPAGLKRVNFGVTVVGATFSDVVTNASAIRNSLLAGSLAAGGTLGSGANTQVVQRIALTGEHDVHGKVDEGSDEIRYGRIQDYECWHVESVPS